MKRQHSIFKWISFSVLLLIFLNSVFASPFVYAQGEVTPTPTTTEMGGFLAPTPTPNLPSSPELQELEQPFSSFQSIQSSSSSLESIWPAFNISDADTISSDSSVAVDADGNVHFLWVEDPISAVRPEIFYAVWNTQNERLSQPINVSSSPSADSSMPQLVVDNTSNAHIVWQEDDTVGDTDVFYSKCESNANNPVTCSTPVNLSGPPDRQCGGRVNPWPDLNSGNPAIGIDGNGNVMVVWNTYEYFWQITQPYSTWNINNSPPSRSTGCAPFGGGISEPYRLVEGHRVMGEALGGFQLVFTSRNINYPAGVYYSQFDNGSWSSPTVITTEEGAHPDIFLDSTNQAHVTVCDGEGQLQYWNSNNQTLEDVLEDYPLASCANDSPVVVDSSGMAHIFWQSDVGKVYLSKRDSGVWSEPAIVNDGDGFQAIPDAVISNINDNEYIHVVWQDLRDGDGLTEIYYSYSYSCDGEENQPETDAGKAVLTALENTDYLYYCKNKVEEVIYVPAKNGIEAFDEWANLASSALNEVAFTVMFWDKSNGSELSVPGENVLAGIKQLHLEVTNEEDESKYPRGMNVRILLGVQFNTINLDSPAPGTDQRFNVLVQMQELDIPLYEALPNGSAWKVEVALYDFGLGSGLPPGIHSHVKLMVVDNNKMIVSGYHPQYGFQTVDLDSKNHDLGIKVSGPIAANGMAVFDSLWEGSEILCTEEDVTLFDIIILIGWGTCHTKIGENPAHWPFTLKPNDNDIVLPLYRDHYDKTADVAVQAAIESADRQVFVVQNRVGVPGEEFIDLGYLEDGLLPYANALIKEAGENTKIQILVSKDAINYSTYNLWSMYHFLSLYANAGGTQQEGDVVRFYSPNGYPNTPPGLHTKAFIVDEEFLVIGSQNFDHSAFGNNDDDLDLVEYSIGIEKNSVMSDSIISNVNGYFESVWENSGRLFIVNQGESLETVVQQALPGDVILCQPGLYEISSTLNIPDGITLTGQCRIKRESNVSIETIFKLASPSLQTTPAPLLRITGDNVSLIGLTLQDSSGYAIEIEGGVENTYISNVVFENNTLGGVYISGNTTYTIESNTFIVGDSGVTIASNVNTTGTIRNNIFAGQEVAPIEITSTNDGTIEYSYNLFYDCNNGSCDSNNWRSGNLGANSTEHDNLFDVDPIFVNPSNGDYQLSANSPAIDAGDPSILHEFLFDGNGDNELRIDIGAFEYFGESSNEPTPTPTPTETPTETPTNTPTNTFTPTSTYTPTPTITYTPTVTRTPTRTPTITPSPTSTPTPTPTFTPTSTPTITPTTSSTVYTLVLQPNGANGLDTYILNTSATSNYGNSADIGIGENNNTVNKLTRTLIKFDLSALPTNATIVSAKLSLWTSTDFSNVDTTYNIYRLKIPFNETQATWNRAAVGVNWQTAGASGVNDRESTSIGSVQILANEPLNTEKQIILDNVKIQELINGLFANNGFILVSSIELNDRFDFKSSDTSTATQRPMLVIQYTIP